jgi:alpha-glucosidase
MLLLTLRGTPTIYYGDEIGMRQVILQTHQIRDPLEKNVPGLGLGRDGCRTPMQWDNTQAAGFSSTQPWLPVADPFPEVNVTLQGEETASIYRLYRALIQLRRAHPALSAGTYRPLKADGDILLFLRERHDAKLLVALNLGNEPVSARLPCAGSGRILLSSFLDRRGEAVFHNLDLRPDEGILVEILTAGTIRGNLKIPRAEQPHKPEAPMEQI